MAGYADGSVLGKFSDSTWSLEDALGSRLAMMGLLNLALNCLSVPRKPGMRKSKRDHNSRTLFWIGVPERMIR